MQSWTHRSLSHQLTCQPNMPKHSQSMAQPPKQTSSEPSRLLWQPSKNGKTCKGFAKGECCSAKGYCGSSSDHCAAGCQSSFGVCNSGSGAVTTDGACGSKNGRICKGFAKGECCSSSGYCGASSGHCGAGCQNAFGVCNGGSAAISTDRNCSKNGKTCKGSTYGDCCSVANYCGKSSAHCGSGW